MDSTFPNSLRHSLISLHLSVWNMNSSRIASMVAGQFRGQVTESTHRGTEVISLMSSVKSVMSIIGGNASSQQLSDFLSLPKRGSIPLLERAQMQEHKERCNS